MRRVTPVDSCHCCADLVKKYHECHPPCQYILCDECLKRIREDFEGVCPACRQPRPNSDVHTRHIIISTTCVQIIVFCIMILLIAICILLSFNHGMPILHGIIVAIILLIAVLVFECIICSMCFNQSAIQIMYKGPIQVRYLVHGGRESFFDRRTARRGPSSSLPVWGEAGEEEERRPENTTRSRSV